jgi:hypothetical protein
MESTRKRPWLAAVLALPITGLGHLYLRRWQRAVGWLLVVTAATVLFVPSGVVETPLTLAGTSFVEATPLFFVVGLSAIDAFLLARQENLVTEIHSAQRCPHCYREHHVDVGFCEWCGVSLSESDG